MFDLIKAKYEPSESVEMEAQGQSTEGNSVVNRREENKANFGLMGLNLILFICSVSLIVYGCVHLKECPAQKMIAVSFIVIGIIFCVSRLLNSRHEFLECMGQGNVPPKPALLIWLTIFLQIFVLGWFFALSYWVYSIKVRINKTDSSSADYCEGDFYKNVFWGTTVALITVGAIIVLTFIALCYVVIKKRL